MLTQHALFCTDVMAKRVILSQNFVTHVVCTSSGNCVRGGGGEGGREGGFKDTSLPIGIHYH
jgi:hypothetical protein